jgi:small-conductance mechanosensitive channel
MIRLRHPSKSRLIGLKGGLCAAGLALLLWTCAAPALAQDVAPTAPTQQPVKVVPEASDAKIAARLQRILNSTGWFEAAQVSVHDGVVFLDGQTGTLEHRAWAGTLAENTQGTVAVVNRIEANADVGSTFARAGDELKNFYGQVARTWPLVALAAFVIFAAWLIARLVAFAARRAFAERIESPLLLSVVARALAIPAFLLGVYFVLQFSGLTRLAVTVLGGTGLIGIIIGFGLRDIAENFLASVLLSVRNPFHSGDLIDVGGHTGVVQNLNVRSTVLLTLDGNQVQIPNSTVYKSIIKNYSSIPSRRAEFTVGIGYDSSAAKAQSLIAEILREHPAVLATPEPLVLVEELGPATVNLRIYYWFDSTSYSPYKINSALLRQTKNALLKGGIELPDSAREVIFPKGVPVIQTTRTAETSREAESGVAAAHAADEMSDTTRSEGDLSNEAVEMRAQQSEGNLPEAQENLLKK